VTGLACLLTLCGLFSGSGIQQTDDFLNRPPIASEASGHRGSGPKGLMHSAEVVVHEVKRDGALKTFDFLGEATSERIFIGIVRFWRSSSGRE
jgi:hypothetical protein